MNKPIVTFGEIMCRLASPANLRLRQTRELEVTYAGAEASVAASICNFGGARGMSPPCQSMHWPRPRWIRCELSASTRSMSCALEQVDWDSIFWKPAPTSGRAT